MDSERNRERERERVDAILHKVFLRLRFQKNCRPVVKTGNETEPELVYKLSDRLHKSTLRF